MTTSLLLMLACAGKQTAPEAPVEAAPPAPEPMPEVETEPEPEPEPLINADFEVTLRMAGGDTKQAHVKRLERSIDWFADKGWTTEDPDLRIVVEGQGTEREVPWTEVKRVAIKPGSLSDIDCYYDSEFQPWMYDCTVKTSATLSHTDGSSWKVTGRHKWRMTFDDDSTAEFWLYKHAAREQDTTTYDLDSPSDQNVELYSTLTTRLKTEVRTSMVTSVTINPQ